MAHYEGTVVIILFGQIPLYDRLSCGSVEPLTIFWIFKYEKELRHYYVDNLINTPQNSAGKIETE